jgi:hypothetical protein
MTDASRPNRWPLRTRRLLVIVLILVLAVLALRVALDIWLGHRLNKEIARLEEQYGPLRWDPARKLDAWRSWPPRLSPENRARALDAAAARVTLSDANRDLIYLPRTALTLTADQARAVAGENREAVQLAIRAAQRRHSNWWVRYLAEPDNVPNLADLSYLSTVLAIAGRSDTDAGRADEAVADVTAGFAEAAAMQAEPLAIMVLNATRVVQDQIDVLKDILGRAEPSGPALAALAAAIDEALPANPMREVMLGELKHARFVWPWIERGSFDGHRDPSPASWWSRAAAWLVRPVIRFMAARDLAERARAVDAASTPRSRRGAPFQSAAPARGAIRSGSPKAAGLIDLGDRWTASVGLAATAVALRRFRLDHGAYPATLDELVPAYVKALSVDPYAGHPPRYVRQGSGFELHSSVPVSPGSFTIPGRTSPWEWKVVR